jgi:NRAMP (natural resistance-associated macrophage protein)-like metal ion transporter
MQEAPSMLPRRFRRFVGRLGPGLITGAADDDPSGISTYSVTGAAFGYAPLWTALFSFPLMTAVQMMCARLGMVTGRGLAGVIRELYSRWVLWGRVRVAGHRQHGQHRRRPRRHGGRDGDDDRD